MPQPSPEELKEHYPKTYYESMTPVNFETQNSFLTSVKYKLKEKVLSYYYNYPFPVTNKLSFIEKLLFFPLKFHFSTLGNTFIPWSGEGKVLDIGCGMGCGLNKLKKLGWETYGVELDEYAAEYAKKADHNIICGTLLEANFLPNFFDVILLSEVLEHLYNPLETLKEIKRIIKPGGKIYISVPISNNLFFKIFKNRWHSLEIPRHLWIPSTKAIKILCYKTGMKINRLKYRRGGEILGSIQYIVNDLGQHRIYLADNKNNKIYRNKFLMKIISPLEFILQEFNLTSGILIEVTKK
ncbi:MAG: class I SAM-dependent methyltransferase [bacterium]|nr:class I SAM-dependent methyltransferase [bacterium]